MSIDRETLIAFADGELDELARARVERAIAADPALAREVEAHRRLRERLAAHYAPVADAPVPERFAALLAGADKVTPIAAARERRAARFALPQWAAIAATLVLGLWIGHTFDPDQGLIESRGGVLIASGRIDNALTTQLASTQTSAERVRIGLTFRSPDGEICRTFEDDAGISGIACNVSDNWQLVRTINDVEWRDAQYRQAASGEIAQAAQAMMAGAPLDAAAEKAARETGWR